MYKFMVSVTLICVFILSACGGNSDQQGSAAGAKKVSPQFRAQLSDAVKIYFELKDALVAANAELAAGKAKSFKAALGKIDAAVLSGEILAAWNKKFPGLQKTIDELIAGDDIEAQRAAFLPVSEELIICAKEFGPLNMTVYVQHCPMAFDNTGGDWLSNSEEIFNPYFGDMMLHCGTVTTTIAGKQ